MRGPALLLLGIALFAALDANAKLLSAGYSLGQVVASRYAVLLVLLLPVLLLWPGKLGGLRTARPGLHALRAGAMMVSSAGFFLGFRHLPLAEGYLVFFTAPFFGLALAALALRERVTLAAWAWCAVGFGGVLISVLPKLGTGAAFGPLLAVGVATLAFAVTQTINRALREERGSARILVWPSLLGLLIYGPLAWRDWVEPPPLDALRLAANGAVAGLAVAVTAAAYRYADAARLGPYAFAALPFSLVLDYAVWGVVPDPATLVGGAVVVFACAMSERARQSKPGGNAWRPSAPSGSATTDRTAASGSGP